MEEYCSWQHKQILPTITCTRPAKIVSPATAGITSSDHLLFIAEGIIPGANNHEAFDGAWGSLVCFLLMAKLSMPVIHSTSTWPLWETPSVLISAAVAGFQVHTIYTAAFILLTSSPGGHEAPICSNSLQPGPGKPDHRLQPQHRHPGHHHPPENREREQRGQAHETDLLLRVGNIG